MCSSKFLARKRVRHQDGKAKCNGVKRQKLEETEGNEASKILCILKAWKINKIIKQSQVSFSQCNLVSFYMGYHFSNEDISSIPLGAVKILKIFQKLCKALKLMKDRDKCTVV